MPFEVRFALPVERKNGAQDKHREFRAALTSQFGERQRCRARDLGVPFEGDPGPLNAITDIKHVEVGHTTLISGEGKLQRGVGPVRTGVTAVWPRGKQSIDPVFGGWFSLNGSGEMTGTAWLEESGFVYGPIMMTNTHSVGTVRDAYIAWEFKKRRKHGPTGFPEDLISLPIVAETFDGFLNDINGFHVKAEHVFQALENTTSGPVPEGNVGGGTGAVCYGFKGGIGTASRKLKSNFGGFLIGVLAQCNCGRRPQLRIAGVPVGVEIPENIPSGTDSPMSKDDLGSIIVVIATDAPLLPHQLKRLARRASLGLARTGAVSGNSSGDIFLAFSTGNPSAASNSGAVRLTMHSNNQITPILEACVQTTEEAIINALIAAETMTGIDNRKAIALPHDRLKQVMKTYNRLAL